MNTGMLKFKREDYTEEALKRISLPYDIPRWIIVAEIKFALGITDKIEHIESHKANMSKIELMQIHSKIMELTKCQNN